MYKKNLVIWRLPAWPHVDALLVESLLAIIIIIIIIKSMLLKQMTTPSSSMFIITFVQWILALCPS